MKKCILVEQETGEILNPNFLVEEVYDRERKKEMAEKDRTSKEFRCLQQEVCGYFIFFIFKNLDKLKEILNDNDLIKFIFIGTYVKKNGALMLDDNKTYINKLKLKKLLNVSDKTFKTVYEKLIKYNLIKENENNLYINLDYFWRGKEEKYTEITEKKMKEFTRIYIKTMRDLYLQTPSRSHKKLVIVFKLLPYVNWKYNILCTNVNEQNKSQILPLTIGNIMDILGYDKTHITRFKKDFYSLTYNNYSMFGTFQKTVEYENSFIVVNPLVFYRGTDVNDLYYLITLFEIEVNNNVKALINQANND